MVVRRYSSLRAVGRHVNPQSLMNFIMIITRAAASDCRLLKVKKIHSLWQIVHKVHRNNGIKSYRPAGESTTWPWCRLGSERRRHGGPLPVVAVA
jgi:hypothetical protein